MYYNITEYITVWDISSLFLGVIFSAFAAIIIIRFFRPKISIQIPLISADKLKITVINESKRYAAINLRIEAAAVLNDKTYHIDFDRKDFLILSRNKKCGKETPFERTFHGKNVNDYTKDIAAECQNMKDFFNILNKKESYLRIRLHAYHEFTGFSKAFEDNFILKQGIFIYSPKLKC